MPEQIGKYRIVERIGRGGMGMIFKAHDPILDRLVALKVISPEVEVTDELRARFFREAKACAKLNHPNIVTVHDMGEDAGRLFIVMELLEGQELRRLIKANTSLTLEDKLSVMLQVCRGLHYAHQNGIVHRDMKPGNIFLLRSGQVKILDFGIAHIATTDAELTRTGLIMGTLRYISPEQLRGRADLRSDMFSIGSVFYEFLTSRPPFLGDDPMQLLEQLRTDDPPQLTELDPTISPELAVIVHRAMRKDPADRFHDVEEMRLALEVVHDRVVAERQHLVARVRLQRERVVQLRVALAERGGAPGEPEPIRAITERSTLVVAQAAERELAGIIEGLEAKLSRVDAVAAAMQRASELMDIGRFEDAAVELEPIVAEMPEHRAAWEALARARTEAEAQRQRRQALRLARQQADQAHEQMARARADALAEEAPQHAPGLWHEAETMAAAAQAHLSREAHAEAMHDFEAALSLYHQAQAQVRELARRQREEATKKHGEMAERRRAATAVEAASHAASDWNEAEASAASGIGAVAGQAWEDAIRAFDHASLRYRRAEQHSRETLRARAEAEKTPEQPTGIIEQSTVIARREDATVPTRTAASSGAATRLSPTEPGVGPPRGGWRPKSAAAAAIGVAGLGLIVLYSWRSQPPPVSRSAPTQSSEPSAPRERKVPVTPAPPRVATQPLEPSPPRETQAQPRPVPPRVQAPSPEPTTRRETKAATTPVAPRVPMEPLAPVAPQENEADRGARQRVDAERARDEMTEARRAAEQAGAARYAPKLLATAQAQEGDGHELFGRSEYGIAGRHFRAAQADYRTAIKEAERQRVAALQQAEQARGEMAEARRATEQAGASRYASSGKAFESATAKERDGQAALRDHDYPQATTLFRGATVDFQAAAQATRFEASIDAEIEKLRRELSSHREAAVKVQAPTLAKARFEAATTREKEAERLAAARNLQAGRPSFQDAANGYDEAARQAASLPPFVPPDDRSAIRQVLDEFKRAYESKDVALVQRVRPGLRSDDLQTLRNTFDNATTYTLDLRVETIEMRGNEAQARAFRQDVMVAKDGQIYRSEARVTVRFKRVRDRWTIDDIK